jgi:hypothetical protein
MLLHAIVIDQVETLTTASRLYPVSDQPQSPASIRSSRPAVPADGGRDDIWYGYTAGFLWQQLLLYHRCIRDISMYGEFEGDLGEPQGRLEGKTPRGALMYFRPSQSRKVILEMATNYVPIH